jgi:hypothetical protein
MKHIITALALMLATITASATTLGLHLGSRHSNYDQPWNDVNPGLYARFDNGVIVGTLRNSERAQSYYAGWSRDWPLTTRLDAGITLGLITGYKRADVLPLVVPSIRLGFTENVGLRTSLLVNPDKRGAHAVHLSVEWKF